MMNDRYTAARAAYAKRGIDTERAIKFAMERELALAITDDDRVEPDRLSKILSLIPGNVRLVLGYGVGKESLDTALTLGVPIDLIAAAEDGVAARRLAAELGQRLGRASRVTVRFRRQDMPRADRIYADKYDTAYVSDLVHAPSVAVATALCERYGVTPTVSTEACAAPILANYAACGYTPALTVESANASFDFALSALLLTSHSTVTLHASPDAEAVISARSIRRAMLYAELTRMSASHRADARGDCAMARLIREEEKLLPFAEVWEEYLCRTGMGGSTWIKQLKSLSQP